MSEPNDKQIEQPKVGELPPLSKNVYDHLKERERQLLAEQQVSTGLRARLDGRFEQLALMSGRAIYAEQLLEKAEASLAEANIKIRTLESQLNLKKGTD